VTTKAFGQGTNNKTATSDCSFTLLLALLTITPISHLPADSVKVLYFYYSSNLAIDPDIDRGRQQTKCMVSLPNYIPILNHLTLMSLFPIFIFKYWCTQWPSK